MSSATHPPFTKDSWQSARNARTLRAYMALRNQEIGQRLRELRRGMPQSHVADELGVSERAYQTWEHGEAKPSYRNLQKLAEFFGVSEGYILEGIDDRPVIEGVPEQLGDVDARFSQRVTNVEEQLDRIERALQDARDERDDHHEKLAGLIETQNRLLRQQSEILEQLTAAVAGLGVPDGLTLQDHLAQLVRDTAVQAAGRPRERSETPENT